MINFTVPVVKIERIEAVPKSTRLDVYCFGEHRVISSRLPNGERRYKEGDLVVFCPVGSIIPEYLLRRGFWIADKNENTVTNAVDLPYDPSPGHGMLGGDHHNEVTPITLMKTESRGILFPVEYDEELKVHYVTRSNFPGQDDTYRLLFPRASIVVEGIDVADFLGIRRKPEA